MARDTIGKLTCPHCGGEADVREDKKRKLYYLCGGANWMKGCGKFAPSTGPGQEWIRKQMRPLNEPAPAPVHNAEIPLTEKDPDPAPAAPQPKNDPARADRPWWDQPVEG